ncbi:MAG: rRNA maturation RNase YbeY [Lachnospiraceae bacterium]|nr:rRNA maturation RNase YbeY [Lachnospiraceae bacterium]
MTCYLEYDEGIDAAFPFDAEAVVEQVVNEVLRTEQCPYEVCVNVLVTDNAGIREFNRTYREIDRETDVLSFPNLDFDEPARFWIPEGREADYFDPESGELILGDIILSVDRVRAQAAEYGHSPKREFAFLVAHSMLHLCGYDHMEPAEAAVMEDKQEKVLGQLGITRDMP